jgi:hypothetical protein
LNARYQHGTLPKVIATKEAIKRVFSIDAICEVCLLKGVCVCSLQSGHFFSVKKEAAPRTYR